MSRDITNLSVGGLVKYKPENFVDTGIVRQLEQSGFIDNVYQ